MILFLNSFMKLKNNAKKKKRENLNKKMAEKSLAYTTVKSKAKKKKSNNCFWCCCFIEALAYQGERRTQRRRIFLPHPQTSTSKQGISTMECRTQ